MKTTTNERREWAHVGFMKENTTAEKFSNNLSSLH